MEFRLIPLTMLHNYISNGTNIQIAGSTGNYTRGKRWRVPELDRDRQHLLYQRTATVLYFGRTGGNTFPGVE